MLASGLRMNLVLKSHDHLLKIRKAVFSEINAADPHPRVSALGVGFFFFKCICHQPTSTSRAAFIKKAKSST